MTSEVQIRVQGLREAQRRCEQMIRDMQGDRFLGAMKKCTLLLEGAVKKNMRAWNGQGEGGSDTGLLRASVTPVVNLLDDNTVQGVVGSNIEHAPFIEKGTKPHWPPRGALAVWAKRHGVSEYAIRRGIALHGTREYAPFRRAFKENMDQCVVIIERAWGNIVRG